MSDYVENPVLNSPYEAPRFHWPLDDKGLPCGAPEQGRRFSSYLIPIPASQSRKSQRQLSLPLNQEAETNRGNDRVNILRHEVSEWRQSPPETWRVSDVTRRLLIHWREGQMIPRPFFCQVEAAETLIWLNEVAKGVKAGRDILQQIKEENDEANPGLFRLAAKMATGSGKTTVMAMLIAYHAVNKARHPKSPHFSNHFLVITPGITIKDRLRVLLPQDPENYYEKHNLVPPDMRRDIKSATVVITNYHAFKHRETRELPIRARQILQGNDAPVVTKENDGQMLARACPELLRVKDVIVINDEAHHCYKHKTDDKDEKIDPDEKEEAEKNEQAARLWINGILALGKKVSVKSVYDLSATPFFLRGSGYPEGTLFPWVASDFSLMDAIESGIVKLPRVPITDATTTGEEKLPIYRNLYAHIKKELPKRGRGKDVLDPQELPSELMGAMVALYGHYRATHESWEKAENVGIPPVFIIVCNNTATSKLVYDYVSGYEINGKWRRGGLPLFNNVGDDDKPLPRPRTLLIDSYQLESGDALSKEFKQAAAAEIEAFKREMRIRYPERNVDKIDDADLLREVMNTVGKKDRLGEQVRCVVSVSMLTEGWDTNNVTHILGVRAFGTQLLCEQVVGRGLRRLNYTPEEDGKFAPEYADIFGVPFNFAPGVKTPPPEPLKPTTRVRHLDERAELAITYPRVRGYLIKPPEERLTAKFTSNSRLKITPEMAPPVTKQEGIVGEGVMMTLEDVKQRRLNEVVFFLAAYTANRYYKKLEGGIAPARFRDLVPLIRLWLKKYVDCRDGTFEQYLLWCDVAVLAAERIHRACAPSEDERELLLPIIDPYTPEGGTFYVDFLTRSKRLHNTREDKSHINIAVCDSDWEMEFCKLLEADDGVFAYARNDGLHFEVPYTHDKRERVYKPDFIVLADDGNGKGNLLNLVVEIKGFRKGDAQAKADTMNRQWVPAVNNDGRWGRWAFLEIMDPQDFAKKLGKYTRGRQEK